jgi:hypothetical protein
MSAFDLIEHEYIFMVLERFGFGPAMMRWFKILYDQDRMKSSVQVNGFISRDFPVRRGIRQGCPLSALIYVLVSEPLLSCICKSPSIRGVILAGTEQKVSAYADDTTLILRDFRSIKHVFEIYESYSKASGAVLKNEKTKLLMLGSLRMGRVPTRLHGFLVETMTLYGITLMYDGFNVQENLKSFHSVLDNFKVRDAPLFCSIFGKIHIFNTYVLSKLWYISPFIPLSGNEIRNIEKVLQNFISKPLTQNAIPIAVMKAPVAVGGANFPDIHVKNESFRLMIHVRRLRATEKLLWHDMYDMYFTQVADLTSFKHVKRVDVPHLFYCIKGALLHRDIVFDDEHTWTFQGKRRMLCSISASILYKLIVSSLFTEPEKPKIYWRNYVQNIDWKVTWQNARTKYVDGFAKNVHYLMLHVSHHTNNRIAKFQPISQNCVSCLLIDKTHVCETVGHVFTECILARLLYDHLKLYFDKIDITEYSLNNLLFGTTLGDKKSERLFNFLVILAHRAIWQVRNKIKKFNRVYNIKDFFDKILLTELWKIYMGIERSTFVRVFSGARGLISFDGEKLTLCL